MAKEGTKVGTASGKQVNPPKGDPPAVETPPGKKPAAKKQVRKFGFQTIFRDEDGEE